MVVHRNKDRPRAAETHHLRVQVGVATAFSIAVAGCLPAPATAEARAISDLYAVLMGMAAVVAAIVLALAIWPILRHRRRGATDLPPQDHGDTRLEVIWTGIPILAVIAIFVLTLGVLDTVGAGSDSRSPASAAGPGVDVRVEAFRWGWRFGYPEAGVVVEGIGEPGPELVVPVREPIRVTITGVDVVHAFYVPQFLFKRDATPGRETSFAFTVDAPGTYRGQCAEFCGVGHPRMPFAVRAVERAEFEAWLASAPRSAVGP